MEKRKLFSLTWSLVIIFTLVAFFTVSANQALASSEKPIELSFASHVPPKAAPYHAAFLPWAKEIEKRSNGRVKIKFYLSQTLYLVKSTYAGAHVLTDLYKKFPEMRAEVKDVHLLHLWTTMPYELHTVKKPIYKLEDIKGMKLATQPGAITVLEAAGAVPVTMPGPKIYTTVEKGVADGSALAWGAFKAYKLVEITKYHTNVHLAALPYCTIMNKNKWNSLPKDVQKVITDVTNEMMPDKLCAAVTAEGVKGRKSVLERKQEIYDMPPKERARWVATAQPAQDKWVKSMEAKGLPGRAVLDEAIKLMKAYK
ncbi:MAG: TRAP transporter substrate-binding protein DctP [Deltaproteobacteria bacterium]|nr:TRAP transporter substrate-binding protein DctP [Deltaproteobacteria bacterium]